MADSQVVYKYYVADIITNQVIGELPFTGVSYENALKDAGSFSGTISLAIELNGIDVYSATMPGKNAVYVMRNGVCVWGGPIWSRSYDVVAKTVSVNANEFTSYYQHRKIWKTWNLTHSGCIVYVDPKNSNQLIVELNKDTGDTVDIDEGVAVELAFIDKKGYNLNGHFRVNKSYQNASKITLDKEALQWNVPNVDHTFKTKGSKITVASRKVVAGSKEVIITTDDPHFLSEGDEVNIENLEKEVDVATYFTYKTLETEYPIAALSSTSTVFRFGNVSSGNRVISDIDTRGISVGATITQLPEDSSKGVIPSIGIACTVVAKTGSTITYSAYTPGSSTNRTTTKTGKVYLKFENKKSGYNYSGTGGSIVYSIQPKTHAWKGKIKEGTLIKTNGVKKFNADAEDPIFGDLGENNFHKVKDIIEADMPRDMAQYTLMKQSTDYVGVPTIRFSRKISTLSNYKAPIVDASFNIVKRSTNYYPYTKSEAAVCANGNGQPVIKVINKKSFVVNSGCEAQYDNTSTNQDSARVAWDGKYQATMYTHTDTYEQVRYFLGKVHEDFVTVDANNPFLGNLEKYQTKIASYDTDTDLATIATGFRQPVYSKKIFYDPVAEKIKAKISLYSPWTQFRVNEDVGELVKITGADDTINGTFYITKVGNDQASVEYSLNDVEQDIIGYYLTNVSADGSYITFTTSSPHNIRAGHLVTVNGLSVSTLNVDNQLVVDTPTSTTIRVASTVANGTSDTTPFCSIYTSDRLVAETRLAPNSSIITFGAHNLGAGNNIEVVGLTRQNYDGVFAVETVPDEVSFTYKPQFESLKITDVQLDYIVDSYVVTVKLNRKPNTKKYAYIPGYTNINITDLGSPYNGTYLLNKFETKTFDDEEYYYFSYKIPGTLGDYTIHPMRTASYSQRKYGTSSSITAANYVRELATSGKTKNQPTGRGVTTFTTSSSHGLSAGQIVAVANVGGEFTQKTGASNAYSEYLMTVTTVPSGTTFTVSSTSTPLNESLWKLKNNSNNDIGKANTSVSSVTGATVTPYDNSANRPDDVYPLVKIDSLPSVSNTAVLTTTVTGKAFNAKTKTVYLQVASDPGFVVGQKIKVDDTDDGRDTIFDGTYTITGFEKWTDKKWQLKYQSGNRSYKKDIGAFDENEKLTKYQKESVSNPGQVTVDSAVYVGSYGSFTQNSDIGLEFSTYEDSGNYQRVPSYRGHELKTVGDYLSEYSDKYIVKPGSTKIIRNVYGFEYRIDCVYDEINSTFKRVFKFLPINYPNAPVHGEVSPPSRFGADRVVFEYPGNISSLSLQESAEESSTRFFMVGSDGGTGTSDASKSYVGVAHTSLLANNWPLLDSTESNDKLDFLSDISENAYRYLNETKPPSGVFSVGVVGNLDPIVGTYKPGDWCSIIVNDKFVRDRLASDLEPRDDVIVRKILSYAVDVPDAPSIPESVTLNLITEWDVDNRGQ